MDNRETLKALVDSAKIYEDQLIDGDGYERAVIEECANACVASIPALEALLAEPSVPVSELEALPRCTELGRSAQDGEYVPYECIRSLINRSHK